MTVYTAASQKLFRSLLFEMVSGNYYFRQRFLSHRKIMTSWRCSATTANLALALLEENNLIFARDRSGHYLREDFREIAMQILAFDALPSMPLQKRALQQRMIGKMVFDKNEPLRIGVILLTPERVPQRRRTIPESVTFDLLAATTARGIFLAAKEDQTHVDFLVSDGHPESVKRAIQRFSVTAPDGVAIVRRIFDHSVSPMANELLRKLIPVVTVFDDCEGTDMISVNFNNIGMGLTAAQTLLNAGHRRIGILIPPSSSGNWIDRSLGFERAIVKAGAGLTRFIITDKGSSEEGESIAKALSQSKTTALYSVGHELIQSLIPFLHTAGLSIPSKLSLLSSSSIPDISGHPKKVDILRMDFEELGKMAYRSLVDYRKGQLVQNCYLVNPRHESYGTIRHLRQF